MAVLTTRMHPRSDEARTNAPQMRALVRFVVVANHRPTSSPEDIAEMEAILASIEFEP